MKEVEIKLPFASAPEARLRLERLDVREVTRRSFEDNRLFDRADGSLQAAEEVLRLRSAGGRSILTYKAPVAGEHRYKVREEHETRLDDPQALVRILERLGFSQAFRYQKYRTEFARGDLEITLDETVLGCFVELEGAPADIDRMAHELGFSPDEYVRDSYLELHEREARRRGIPPGDLLLATDEPQ